MVVMFIVLLLLIATWNAYVILWGTEVKDPELRKRYSKIWHFIGLVVRLSILASFIGYQIGSTDVWYWAILYSLLFLVFGGIAYDFIINLIRYKEKGTPPLLYVDEKGFNLWFLNSIQKIVPLFCVVDISREEIKNMYWYMRFIIGFVLLAFSVSLHMVGH